MRNGVMHDGRGPVATIVHAIGMPLQELGAGLAPFSTVEPCRGAWAGAVVALVADAFLPALALATLSDRNLTAACAKAKDGHRCHRAATFFSVAMPSRIFASLTSSAGS